MNLVAQLKDQASRIITHAWNPLGAMPVCQDETAKLLRIAAERIEELERDTFRVSIATICRIGRREETCIMDAGPRLVTRINDRRALILTGPSIDLTYHLDDVRKMTIEQVRK